jgi:hypothetical protein
LRALTDAIVEQGRPSTAVLCREIMMQVFRWAIERGQKVENPADWCARQLSPSLSREIEH